jgi:hypothetical protein
VALVERQEAAGAEASRQHDDRKVGEPHVEVGVLPIELEDHLVLHRQEALDPETSADQVEKKCLPRRPPEPTTEEIVDFGRDWCGYDELLTRL